MLRLRLRGDLMTQDDELTGLRATLERLRAENEALVARAADVERHAAERERAEQRARTILESVRDAFFSLDRDFRFTYLNPQAERFLRRSSAELVGKDLFVEFPAAVGTVFDREYRRAMRDRVPVQFVEHYPHPLDRWYEVRADPAPEGLSVYFQDITERLAAEEEHRVAVDAIRRGREQMELVVRSADVGVWFCPLPFDVLVWDAKVKEHFHLPPDATVTIDTFYARLHPDDRERTRSTIDASIAARGGYDIDYRTVSPDGRSTKWIRALGRTFCDARGEPVQFDGITIDVSARKRVELALQESEERYRLATRATDDAIWDWDVQADTIRWNESLGTRFLHPIEATSAAWWLDHVHPDERAAVAASLEAAMDDPGREHWHGEYRFRRGDGTWAEVLDRGYLIRDAEGRAVRMLGSMTDRTQERSIERQKERMVEAERAARGEAERQVRMKDEFLATVSHELRTPLNAVVGWTTIARRNPAVPAEVARALEVIERNARAQARIIDDLLDMTSMHSGKLRLELQPTDLAAVVEAAIAAARPAAEARGITISLASDAGDRSTVSGDPSRLQQALSNLLTNAIKFSHPGGDVTVTLGRAADTLTIAVIDHGEGIAPDFLPHVFDRFRQADASTTRRHGGLGLGLAIVEEVVRLHGGSVRAESAGLGLGATVVLTLPAAEPAGPAVASVPPASAEANADLRALRVLVVDDEADARLLVARLLEERRATVVTTGSVDEAVDLVRGGEVDVVVSDVGMPGEDGFDLLRRVRALRPHPAGDVPVLALTAYTRDEDRQATARAGFEAHLGKPVRAAELIAAVAAARGRHAG